MHRTIYLPGLVRKGGIVTREACMCIERCGFEGCRYCTLRVTPCGNPRLSSLLAATARFRSQAHAEARQEPRQDITRDSLREDVAQIVLRVHLREGEV